jgi:hypothetical protein
LEVSVLTLVVVVVSLWGMALHTTTKARIENYMWTLVAVVAISHSPRLHQIAYGSVYIKPKHHWMMDVSAQLVRDQCVLDAFIIERTHLVVKGIADHIRNTSSFEKSVLSGVTTLAFENAATGHAGDCLVGRCAPLPGFPGVHVADKMSIFNIDVSVDDIILRGDAAGVVVACALENGRLLVVVDLMVEVRNLSSHTSVFNLAGQHEVWSAADVGHCLVWYCQPDGSFVVIRM